MLKAIHKQRRVDWAKYHQTRKDQWHCVIFSDEKKFNLDGPGDLAFYWHGIRKEEEIFSKRQQGGGSLMVSPCSLLLPFSESLLRSADLPENLLHDVGESEHGDSEPAAKKSTHVTEDFAALRK
ncbi:hypothetical protein AVEN_101831-1 [Araneus ventricosus]|uniref:Uncharacterized protein n=1 Tax=Araneus ventricosus TaxID=182803 RepID=A0A4Y2LE45_ARAVE|nr:hypothetical protein AVEN_101831-1 [Araneus ventricosus]